MDNLFQKVYSAKLLKIALVILLLILLFPFIKFAHSPNSGIDPSWQIALELIRQKGLVFGSDVIYTYGPLGYLQQRLPIYTNTFTFFIYDFFFFTVVGILFYLMLPKGINLVKTIFFFFVFLTAIGIPGEWSLFLLFFSGLYFGITFLHTRSLWYLYLAIIISLFTFYTKANYGLIALLFVYGIEIYAVVFKIIGVRNFAISIASSCLALITCNLLLNVDFWAYIYSSIEVVKGYNEAQSVFPTNRLRIIVTIYLLFGAISVITLIGFIINSKQIYQKLYGAVKDKRLKLIESLPNFNELCVLTIIWGVSFILLKYSVVRTDDGHITAFVKLIILPLSLFVYFTKRFRTIGLLLIGLNVVSYFTIYQPRFNSISYNVFNNIKNKSVVIPIYFKGLFDPPDIVIKKTFPERILSKIGNKTVDIIPNEISALYFNGLNYQPRPSLQSYTSYTTYIDTQNYEMYTGPNAPEFIVYYIDGLDKKYGFGDETITLLGILENYEAIDYWQEYVLLQKKPMVTPLIYTSRKTISTKIDQTVLLDAVTKPQEPPGEMKMVKLDVNYNLWGKLLNLFFQPPSLNLELTTQDGVRHSYKTSPKIIGKGLIINNLIESGQDFTGFMQQKSKINSEIKHLKISENVILISGIESTIIMQYSSFKIEKK